jgi:CheY-like chemotaxis protein
MAKLAQMDIETPVKIQVVESVDGHDAWAKLNQGKFDLLIIDLYMPVLDGHGFIKRVRASAEHRHIPIVAVSAGSDVRAEALASGADIFLPKPVKLSDIVITVKTLLRLDL